MSQNDLMTKFGTRLAHLRRSQALTQEELAERAEVSVDFLSLMERGLRAPSFATLSRLADALETQVAAFFDFDGQVE